jgi:transcriptional regulator with XRE-family HTH domain
MLSKTIAGRNLRHFRERAGLSQAELSEQCGISRTMIQNIEQCLLKRGPTIGLLDSIAKSLDTTAWQIICPKQECK